MRAVRWARSSRGFVPATTRSLAGGGPAQDTVAMRTTRRRVLAAASATATAAAAPALAQSKETEASGFEEALRAKFAAGDVLDWRGGNVRLRRPIVIEVTSNQLGPGLDLNGAKLIADFNDATKRAITIRIPTHAKNVALRGMKILNGTIFAAS